MLYMYLYPSVKQRQYLLTYRRHGEPINVSPSWFILGVVDGKEWVWEDEHEIHHLC